jgi:hypothetical protein
MKIIAKVFGFLFGFLLTSCVVYYPQTADIPLISKKNDLRIDGGISTMISANATVSYGLTNNVAVQAYGDIFHGYYCQGAMGYYKNLGDFKVIELYCGFGSGYGNAYKDANPGNLFGDYQLYFGQLNYGKIASETSNLEIGFGIKTGYLHSNLTDKNYYDWISENGPFKTYLDESLLFEPVGFIRIGGQKLRFSVKLGGTMIHKFTNTDRSLPYSYINLGLGINYRF